MDEQKPEWQITLIAAVRSQMAARAHSQHQAAVEMGMASQSQLNDLLHGRIQIGLLNARRMAEYAGIGKKEKHAIVNYFMENA